MPDMAGRTFADTASYFEARAKKERSDDRRADFADTARFYRALSRITPTFPYGYRQPTFAGLASSLSKRAEECKAIAAVISNPECRAKLLRLAATYERVSDGPAIAAE